MTKAETGQICNRIANLSSLLNKPNGWSVICTFALVNQPQLRDLTRYMDAWAPPVYQESYDNAGLSVDGSFTFEALTDPSLSAYVQGFYRFNNTRNAAHLLTTLPDGCFDLIVFVRDEAITQCSLYGIWTNELTVQVPASTLVLGVSFKPLAAEAIFDSSIAPIINASQPVTIANWQLDQLAGQTLSEFSQWMTQQCLARLAAKPLADSRRQQLFALLDQTAGSLPVNEVASQIGWSSRQLNRYMNRQFGLSLKTYSALLRCHASYSDIKKGVLFPQQPFFDQSHFIRDIRRHTGATPTELLRNKDDRFLQFRS